MTKAQCDLYALIKEDALWILRHVWVFYITPAVIYLQFIAWVAAPEVTEAAIWIAFTWATVDVLMRLKKYLIKK